MASKRPAASKDGAGAPCAGCEWERRAGRPWVGPTDFEREEGLRRGLVCVAAHLPRRWRPAPAQNSSIVCMYVCRRCVCLCVSRCVCGCGWVWAMSGGGTRAGVQRHTAGTLLDTSGQEEARGGGALAGGEPGCVLRGGDEAGAPPRPLNPERTPPRGAAQGLCVRPCRRRQLVIYQHASG